MNVVPMELGVKEKEGDIANGAEICEFFDLQRNLELDQVSQKVLNNTDSIDHNGSDEKVKDVVFWRFICGRGEVWIVIRKVSPANTFHEESVADQCELHVYQLLCLEFIEFIEQQKLSPGIDALSIWLRLLPVNEEDVKARLFEDYLVNDNEQLANEKDNEDHIEG